MNTKAKKTVLKSVFAIATSLALGQLIKLERQIEENIDRKIEDYFEPETEKAS